MAAGDWGQVNTQGGCLKVRISYEENSLAIDCLPYRMLVFVDDVQTIDGARVAHLAGRGYVHPEGLTVVANPAENPLGPGSRPPELGRVALVTVDGNVWTVSAAGANPAPVTGGPGQPLGAFYSAPAWSPDGRRLLLRRDTDRDRAWLVYEPGSGLRSVDPAPGSPATGMAGVAAWSQDSAHVVIADYDAPGNACERTDNQYVLRSVDVGTGDSTELYRGQTPGYVATIAPSPDGHNLALLFGSGCDDVSFNLCLLALVADPAYAVQAGQLRCPRGARAGQIAWSPDSRFVAFTGRLQGRGDESALPTDLPLELMDARSTGYYPLAFPSTYYRNVIGVAWLPDGRTLRLIEEVPRGLTDTDLPERTIRRITIDGSRVPIVEMGGDRLLDVRPTLAPGTLHGDYALATGPKGELWVLALAAKDARWRLTDAAVTAVAWTP